MTIFYSSKVLRTPAFLLAIVALSTILLAQDLPPPVTAGDASPIQFNSTNPPDDTTTLPDDDKTKADDDAAKKKKKDDSQDSANGVGQQQTPTPLNPTGAPNTPLVPTLGANPSSPLTTYSENQPSPTSNPILYNTGSYNLSQIATNNALQQAYGAGSSSGFSSDETLSFSHPLFERIRLGPLDLRASVTTSVVSDDNLTGSSGSGSTASGTNSSNNTGKLSDTVLSITPVVVLVYGAHEGQRAYASLVYAPTINRYFQHSGEDNVNQNVGFSASYPFQRLTLDVSDTYLQITGINQDINARTTQTSNVLGFGGTYSITDKLQLSTHVQELDTSYDNGGGFGDSITSLNNTFAYQASDKLTIGPSFNIGWDRPEGSSDQYFEQALVTFNYQASDKITLSGNGGIEVRQFGSETVDIGNAFPQHSEGGTTVNPIFGAGIGYAPFDSTKIAISGYQSQQASSGATGQSVTNLGVGFGVTQRFLHRFYLGVQVSYSHSDYKASAGGGNSNQTSTGNANNNFTNTSQTNGSTQENFVYRPSITFAPTVWSSVGLYYQYQDNKSSTAGLGFHDNQAGVSVSAEF